MNVLAAHALGATQEPRRCGAKENEPDLEIQSSPDSVGWRDSPVGCMNFPCAVPSIRGWEQSKVRRATVVAGPVGCLFFGPGGLNQCVRAGLAVLARRCCLRDRKENRLGS